MKGKIVIATMCLLLGGCKTVKCVPVETVRHVPVAVHDTVRTASVEWRRDSVYVHAKGDTTVIERWRTLLRHDTLWSYREKPVVATDTVQVAYPVEKRVEVNRPLAWWQKALMWLGGLCLAAAGAGLLWKLRKG